MLLTKIVSDPGRRTKARKEGVVAAAIVLILA